MALSPPRPPSEAEGGEPSPSNLFFPLAGEPRLREEGESEVRALRGVIFDLDGTLADTLPVCYAAFRATFRRYLPGQHFTDADIAAHFGPSEEGMLQRLVSAPEYEASVQTYLSEYEAAHAQCDVPFAGLTEALDELRERGVLIAVVTGKGAGSAAISLRRLGLASYFDLVEAGSVEGAIKPEAIGRVLEQWKLPPTSVAYVGDAPSDVTSARTAGVLPLSAAWASTADPDALAAMRPAALFRTVPEFTAWVRQHAVASPHP